MRCVSIVSYSLINGFSSDPFIPIGASAKETPSRLICFFFVQKASLPSLLLESKLQGRPLVSHLLFADDSILFFRANQVEINKIKEIISV